MTLIDSTSISAIISAVIATGVSLYVTKKSLKDQETSNLYNEIQQFILIAINYPYLEQDSFCQEYDPNSQDEKYLRYDNYCCLVFNFLERMWKHFNGDKAKIENFFGMKEMVVRHQKWWQAEINHCRNIEGYELKFCDFLNQYLPFNGYKGENKDGTKSANNI
jgi:hypothetical protein